MKNYQWQNFLPLAASIYSGYLIINKFTNTLFYYIGLLLIIVGLLFWWTGKIKLGSAFGIFSEPKKLVTQGIYSKIRNPIYIGLSLVSIGWILINKTIYFYFFAIFVIISSIIRVKFEEKKLQKKFGAEYSKYKERTWL